MHVHGDRSTFDGHLSRGLRSEGDGLQIGQGIKDDRASTVMDQCMKIFYSHASVGDCSLAKTPSPSTTFVRPFFTVYCGPFILCSRRGTILDGSPVRPSITLERTALLTEAITALLRI